MSKRSSYTVQCVTIHCCCWADLAVPGDPVHREPLQCGAAEDHGSAPHPHSGGQTAEEHAGGQSQQRPALT